ncbi:MAG TPA: NADH-quinone oxidoreductase subunit M [Streptosporangiaceae bacterium]|jgi:NADH-quinone oxidoreductase subunit M|nr:NADH-quinone oxidoreductase subunit M [Streptosporangiaceae bacterium]
MSNFPWLTVLGAVPLAGALVLALTPGRSAPGSVADRRARDLLVKRIALVFTLITLALSIVIAVKYSDGGPRFQFQQVYQWIPQFGVHYAVGVDGIALVLILMTTVLMPVVILASWNDVESLTAAATPGSAGDAGPGAGAGTDTPAVATASRPAGRQRSAKSYFAMMLVLETMMIGVFAATDVFLFYVFFEAMLVPMYFMIGSYGVGQRQYAAVKFLLYSLLGGLLMLVAVIALYVESTHGGHQGTFLFTQLSHLTLSPTTQRWLFLGFFIAFAIKAPVFPFHTWLPDAAASAQPGAAVILVGVLDKVGTFGMIRYCLDLFPNGAHYFTPLVLVLAVIGILYGAIVAIGQRDMKRLIAYTSVSHMGLITLGIFAMTSEGQTGATLYMVNHGFATGALFILAGFLVARRKSHLISDYGGVQKVAPVLAGLFLIAGLAGLSLPGLSTFVSEFLVLVGTFTRYEVAAALATVGIILAAIYILWMYQRTMTGPVREEIANMPDLKARELWAVGPLIVLIVVLGVYPKPVLDIINPAVHSTLVGTHSTDPVPPHPATAPATAASTTSLLHHQHRPAGRTLTIHKQGSSA